MKRFGASLVLGGVAVAIAVPTLAQVAPYLPVAAEDLVFSFSRMIFAYALSLGFALAYGYYAATSRAAERVLIPVLDILQSVPILGFFPVAVFAFIAVFGVGNPIGPNLASVFLIFTSMVWNMVFGVYESLKSIPGDLSEAASSFGVRGRQRFRQLLLPATVNRLVYNSVLSWTGGWFFLVAAEFIASPQGLQGIGTFLLNEEAIGNTTGLVAGLLVLIALIVVMDFLLWRPLSRWAEKYRYDTAPSVEAGAPVVSRRAAAPFRRAVTVLARRVRTGFLTASTPFVSLGTFALGRGQTRRRSLAGTAARYVGLGTLLVLVWLMLIAVGFEVYSIYVQPLGSVALGQLRSIPVALLASMGRLLSAYLLSFAVAFPLALILSRRQRAARFGLPAVEILASIPATAVFPLIVYGLVGRIGPQVTSVLMLSTGMIWYLFFNVLSGMRAIPPDLEEASRSFGLRGGPYYRRVLFPAIFPAFITGSITAFGGGWNTLIVAEYLLAPSGGTIYQVHGIGQLLDVGYAEGSYAVLVAALFTLVLAVVTINELVWKPLYRRAVNKYRYE